MSTSFPDIIKLLSKHQYLVKISMKNRDIVVSFPEKYIHSSYNSSIVKYKLLKNPSRIRVTYQSLGKKNKRETIEVPNYAVLTFICTHVINICNSFYNYDVSLIQYYINDRPLGGFSFWGEYLKILRLSSDDVDKHTTLTLICGLCHQGGTLVDLKLRAEQSGVIDGFNAVYDMLNKQGVSSAKGETIEQRVVDKHEKLEKNKFSIMSLFKRKKK